ncbi:hypothetical protein DINM_004699 [Dirofilaria immitis]|nr:hypothetical protein [Dirofilaria immitis]
MSRIDLKGFGGRYLPNDFDDFNFGVLPEDDDFDGEQPNDNIDAVNDETFGVDVDDGVLDDDLEQYSKQTAGLHLDDETPKWFDEPTCSVSAPHPSELPTPPFGFNSLPSKMYLQLSAKISEISRCSWYVKHCFYFFGTTDTLWKNIDSATSSLGWSDSEPSTLQHSSVYNSINKTILDRTNFLLTKNNISSEECFDKNDGIRSLVAVPKMRLLLKKLKEIMSPVHQNQCIQQCCLYHQTTASTPDVYRSTVVLPPDSRIPPMIPPPPPAPPPPQCLPFPMLPPFAVQIARAHLLGHLPELPPGFPPITPQMRAAILSLGPPPVMRMPSHVMLPPFPFMQQSSQLMSVRSAVPSYLPCPSQSQMQSNIPQMPHHNMSYSRDRSSKLTGLVSNKTISDFALYPFAGFVSKKERSWLIKIQQLQCQGCGNPYEDDFYFTTWKQQKMKLEKQKGVKPEDDESDYMCCATNSHHCPYVPPTFVGSLGKPTLSTINYLRQLIDLSSDSPDDDDKLSMRTNTSQKKLRALLCS